MTVRILPNAFADPLGDSLGVNGPLYLLANATVKYVDSTIGTDAASSGGNPENPYATLAYAYSTCTANEYVILAAAHNETLTAAITISTPITIIGLGSSGGKPTASLTLDAAADYLINATGTDVQLRNIFFGANVSANTTKPVVKLAGSRDMVRNCYFECSENNGYPALQIAADIQRVELTTFVSVATAAGSLPRAAIYVSTAVNDLHVSDMTVDGGQYGWTGLTSLGTGGESVGLVNVNRLWVENLSLLRGSDASVSSSVGFISRVSATGDSEVLF